MELLGPPCTGIIDDHNTPRKAFAKRLQPSCVSEQSRLQQQWHPQAFRVVQLHPVVADSKSNAQQRSLSIITRTGSVSMTGRSDVTELLPGLASSDINAYAGSRPLARRSADPTSMYIELRPKGLIASTGRGSYMQQQYPPLSFSIPEPLDGSGLVQHLDTLQQIAGCNNNRTSQASKETGMRPPPAATAAQQERRQTLGPVQGVNARSLRPVPLQAAAAAYSRQQQQQQQQQGMNTMAIEQLLQLADAVGKASQDRSAQTTQAEPSAAGAAAAAAAAATEQCKSNAQQQLAATAGGAQTAGTAVFTNGQTYKQGPPSNGSTNSTSSTISRAAKGRAAPSAAAVAAVAAAAHFEPHVLQPFLSSLIPAGAVHISNSRNRRRRRSSSSDGSRLPQSVAQPLQQQDSVVAATLEAARHTGTHISSLGNSRSYSSSKSTLPLSASGNDVAAAHGGHAAVVPGASRHPGSSQAAVTATAATAASSAPVRSVPQGLSSSGLPVAFRTPHGSSSSMAATAAAGLVPQKRKLMDSEQQQQQQRVRHQHAAQLQLQQQQGQQRVRHQQPAQQQQQQPRVIVVSTTPANPGPAAGVQLAFSSAGAAATQHQPSTGLPEPSQTLTAHSQLQPQVLLQPVSTTHPSARGSTQVQTNSALAGPAALTAVDQGAGGTMPMVDEVWLSEQDGQKSNERQEAAALPAASPAEPAAAGHGSCALMARRIGSFSTVRMSQVLHLQQWEHRRKQQQQAEQRAQQQQQQQQQPVQRRQQEQQQQQLLLQATGNPPVQCAAAAGVVERAPLGARKNAHEQQQQTKQQQQLQAQAVAQQKPAAVTCPELATGQDAPMTDKQHPHCWQQLQDSAVAAVCPATGRFTALVEADAPLQPAASSPEPRASPDCTP